jgi:pimeloyl-ACP methyl ester carboxylesterase
MTSKKTSVGRRSFLKEAVAGAAALAGSAPAAMTRQTQLAQGRGGGPAALAKATGSYAITDGGIRLYYEETGTGRPVVFVHEFAGDLRSWEPQMRHFGRRYRCIAFNARGYPPSDVPESVNGYSQTFAADDIKAVLDHLAIDRGHVVGLSMGGFAVLHFGLRYPNRALSLCVAGCGYGAEPSQRAAFRAEAAAIAEFIKSAKMPAFAEKYAYGPTRVQFENKDPRGFAEFKRTLAEHSEMGSANTQLGVQRERPSLFDLVDDMKRLTVPTLVLSGDEDWPCLQPGILMKQNIRSAALTLMANCGHTVNLEAPDEFNRILGDFVAQVDSGRWPMRDPRAVSSSITGMKP